MINGTDIPYQGPTCLGPYSEQFMDAILPTTLAELAPAIGLVSCVQRGTVKQAAAIHSVWLWALNSNAQIRLVVPIFPQLPLELILPRACLAYDTFFPPTAAALLNTAGLGPHLHHQRDQSDHRG